MFDSSLKACSIYCPCCAHTVMFGTIAHILSVLSESETQVLLLSFGDEIVWMFSLGIEILGRRVWCAQVTHSGWKL